MRERKRQRSTSPHAPGPRVTTAPKRSRQRGAAEAPQRAAGGRGFNLANVPLRASQPAKNEADDYIGSLVGAVGGPGAAQLYARAKEALTDEPEADKAAHQLEELERERERISSRLGEPQSYAGRQNDVALLGAYQQEIAYRVNAFDAALDGALPAMAAQLEASFVKTNDLKQQLHVEKLEVENRGAGAATERTIYANVRVRNVSYAIFPTATVHHVRVALGAITPTGRVYTPGELRSMSGVVESEGLGPIDYILAAWGAIQGLRLLGRAAWKALARRIAIKLEAKALADLEKAAGGLRPSMRPILEGEGVSFASAEGTESVKAQLRANLKRTNPGVSDEALEAEVSRRFEEEVAHAFTLKPGDAIPKNVRVSPRPQGKLTVSEGDKEGIYLYTIDREGLHIVRERIPFQTPRGNVVHSNLSDPEKGAFTAGELRFVHKPGEQPEVIINGGSGRFGPQTPEQWDATIKLFQAKGFKVNAVPFMSR